MDFDQQQRETQDTLTKEFGDHEFTLRGQKFRLGRIVPYPVLRNLARVSGETSDAEAFIAVEQSVLAMIHEAFVDGEDGKGGEWVGREAARAHFLDVINNLDTDFPVTYGDMLEVQGWMIREATRRPPTQDSSSSATPSSNGTS